MLHWEITPAQKGKRMSNADSVSHRAVVEWLIPWLLGAVLAVLGWIGANIHDMSKSMAVAVTRLDGVESDVDQLRTTVGSNSSELQQIKGRVSILELRQRP
jgi:flagellin-like hook-associated protein FlgL